MAIKSSFEHNEIVYPEAYIVVKKISTAHALEEYFEIIDDSFEVLRFKKIYETKAFIFVYGNKEARDNDVHPIHGYQIDFEYDSVNGGNIYKEAYEALKKTELIQSNVWEDC